MNTLLAAIDDAMTAQPVLQTATRLTHYLDSNVVAVHVSEDGGGATARALADAAGVMFEARRGDAATELVNAMHDLDAVAIVIGARDANWAAMPAGHVALDVAQHTRRPVVIVPPDTVDHDWQRVLVAVQGDGESETLGIFAESLRPDRWPEVVALHVFEANAMPMFADQPTYETAAWVEEFMHRVPSANQDRVRLEVRVGNAADVVRDTAREVGADVVVMAWRRDLSPGHAPIVRELLSKSPVPVVLLASDAKVRAR
jgi:nucleotide-binding universal stress UspA family protein